MFATCRLKVLFIYTSLLKYRTLWACKIYNRNMISLSRIQIARWSDVAIWKCFSCKMVFQVFLTDKSIRYSNDDKGLLTTLLKMKLSHRCFPVHFPKFLRTLFSQNTSGRLLLFIINYDETYQNIYLDKCATITKKTRAAFNRITNYLWMSWS